ncbi:unnamed protein product [Schistosoma curassoni]|uniref:Dentin sialophosphoprotein-like n=1 Tax=Schistosoma curassoni TaxID=6186 RepID=A0A183KAH8_9TREM|nr:unnamed protein product [Schistosoma curassoni]
MNNFNKRFLSKCITDEISSIGKTDSGQDIEPSIVSDVFAESVDSLNETTNVDSHKEGTSNLNSSESIVVADVANTETVVNLTSNPPESTIGNSDNNSDSSDNSDVSSTLTTETDTTQNDIVVPIIAEGSENHTESTSTVTSGENDTESTSTVTSGENHTESTSTVTSGENHTESTSTVTSGENHTETVISDSTSENLDNHTEAPTDANAPSPLIVAVGDLCKEFGIYMDTQLTSLTSGDLKNQTESTGNSDITPYTQVHSVDENRTDDSHLESTSESVDIRAQTSTETPKYPSPLMKLIDNLCKVFTNTNEIISDTTEEPTEIITTTETNNINESETKSTDNETQSVSNICINTMCANETGTTTEQPSTTGAVLHHLNLSDIKSKKCKTKKSDEDDCETDSENEDASEGTDSDGDSNDESDDDNE